MASPQLRTVLNFIETFRNLDAGANIAFRSPGCIHTMAPASLGYPAEGMRNEQFRAHCDGLKKFVIGIPVTPKEIFEHPSSNQVTVWATSETIFRDEVIDDQVEWSYLGEYIFVFTLNEQGDKIERIVEFLDSNKVVAAKTLLERAQTNLNKKFQG